MTGAEISNEHESRPHKRMMPSRIESTEEVVIKHEDGHEEGFEFRSAAQETASAINEVPTPGTYTPPLQHSF